MYYSATRPQENLITSIVFVFYPVRANGGTVVFDDESRRLILRRPFLPTSSPPARAPGSECTRHRGYTPHGLETTEGKATTDPAKKVVANPGAGNSTRKIIRSTTVVVGFTERTFAKLSGLP